MYTSSSPLFSVRFDSVFIGHKEKTTSSLRKGGYSLYFLFRYLVCQLFAYFRNDCFETPLAFDKEISFFET